jgi:hypothetical protein
MPKTKNQSKKSQITPDKLEQTLLVVLLILFAVSLAYVFFVKDGLSKQTQLIEPTIFTQNQ